MKKNFTTKNIYISTILIFIFVSTFCLSTLFAEDSHQWHLPDGAKMRLGKGGVNGITYSPDGTTLAVASNIGIWIYDAQTGKELNLITGNTGWVNSVAFNHDGTTIASGSEDNTIRLWNAKTGAHIRTLSEHTDSVHSVSFSPDGNTIASGSLDGTVLLWDLTAVNVD